MAAAWVVEALDVVEVGEARLGVGAPARAVDELALQRGKEARGREGIQLLVTSAVTGTFTSSCGSFSRTFELY